MGGSGKGSGKGVRKNDGFAKRNASSTKFSRKIGWLNSHGKLLEEIRFSEVKEWLSKIGEDEAMIILQSLEKKAGEIQHPTNYVISAARNSLGGGRQRRGKGGGKRKGSALDQSKSPPEPEEAPSRPAPAEPVEPVDIEEEEEEHEDSMGVHLQAGEEPSPEEEAADTPMEHEEADEEDSAQGETMDAAKVEDSLRYLNAHANLNQELEVERLLDPLIELGPVKAMGILQNLEQKSSEVRDPTGYVLAAIRKGSNGSGQAQKSGGRKVMKLHLKENRSSSSSFDPAQVEKVKKRINWLNDRGGLNDKLTYEIVGDLLLRSGPIGEIMKILKTLEENAAEVRNPNNYIAKAARRLAEEGVAPEPQSSANRRAAAQGGGDFRDEPGDFRAEPLEKQLHAHISWLNREVQLNATLDFGQVAPYLLQLPPEHAGDILSRLEKSAAEVRDPNSYVVKAAQRNLEGRDSGGKGAGRRQPPPPPRAMQAPEPPPSRNSAAPSDKIAKRVAWLNQHTQLAAPLDYDRLAPALQSIGYYQSLDVLNTLEEHASTVRDPNAYVLAGIRKVAGEGRGQPAMQALPAPPMPHPMPPPPPQGHARGEEKVVRRLEWLNKNVCPGKPIDINRAAPVLLECQTSKAMEVLKNFEENTDTVRDPTGYVIGTARKAAQGQHIGTSPREPREPPEERKVQPPAPPRPRQSAKGAGRPEPIGSFSNKPREPPAAARGGAEGRIRTRINWLNDRGGLQAPMDADRAASQLSRVPTDREAMEILKRVEESASSIRDPTAYVVSAVRRIINEKGGR